MPTAAGRPRVRRVVLLLLAPVLLAVLAAPPAASSASAATAGWRDDFDTFDTSVWNKIDRGCFDPANVGVSGGQLWLRIVRAPDNEDCHGVEGARINTYGKRQWPAGTFSARIKFHTLPGSWQTFWLTGANGKPFPGNGEVDVAEITGRLPAIANHRLHSSKKTAALRKCTQGGNPVVYPDGVWRTYSVTTGAKSAVFRVDGKVVGRYAPNAECTWPFGDDMRILISARGGQYGGWVALRRYPVTYYVDWVEWRPAA
jgi:beta-glucanase (GH16 family)